MPITRRYTITQTTLGPTLVAMTEKGVCCILMDDSETALRAALQARFPADILQEDPTLDIAAITAHIDNPQSPADTIAFDVTGTPFQQKVWNALRAIPAGKTASYTDIASTLGAPAAIRAVAGACAANPVAVLIPCHRVLRKDGGLSGYRWGVARKQMLLKKEAGLSFAA